MEPGQTDRSNRPLPVAGIQHSLTPVWIAAYPPFEQQALTENLDRAIKLDPDIAAVEKQYQLLERFEPIREALLKSARQTPAADALYAQLIDTYASIASYAALYTRLFSQRLVDPLNVQNLLDLGPGYWNSACVYEEIFPRLSCALGIESDSGKRATFQRDRNKLLKPSAEIFSMIGGDFFTQLPALCSQALEDRQRSSERFDLALLQSYYPNTPHSNNLYSYTHADPHTPADYAELLGSIGQQLTSEGKLIVSLDYKDIEASISLGRFADLLISSGAKSVDDQRLARDPTWGVLLPISMKVLVISREALVSHA